MFYGPTWLVVAVLARTTGARGHRWPRRMAWILAYLAWVGISLLWTFAENRIFAAALYVSMAADVAAALILLSDKRSFRSSINGIIAGALAIAALTAVQLIINPDAFQMEHLGIQEDTGANPNLFGYHLSIGALACYFLALNGRKWMLLPALALTAALIATTSKTSILVFAVVMVFYLVTARAAGRAKTVAIAALLVAGCLAAPYAAGYLLAYESSNTAGSLTGRIPLWLSLAGRAAERPFLGYGFMSVKDISDSLWGAMHAHNDLLQLWVTLGIPGLALAIILYALVWRRLRSSESQFAALGLLWLLFAIGHGLADSDELALGFPVQMMALFFYPLPMRIIGAARRAKRRLFIGRPEGSGLQSE
jgi:O-antigen ligase